MLKRHLKKARIAGATVHTLRHSFAVQNVVQGASLKTTKEFLGLKDTRAMSIYVSLARSVVHDTQKHLLQNIPF